MHSHRETLYQNQICSWFYFDLSQETARRVLSCCDWNLQMAKDILNTGICPWVISPLMVFRSQYQD